MVLSMFIHNISLKHNRETTEFNLFHASLLRRVAREFHFSLWEFVHAQRALAWISPDYFESLLLLQLLRGENDSKQSDEFQAKRAYIELWMHAGSLESTKDG